METVRIAQTILTDEILIFLGILIFLLIRRKTKLRQYVFITGLFSTFAIFNKLVFRDIFIGKELTECYYNFSMIPFKNLCPTFMFQNYLQDAVLSFFISTLPFFILFGFFLPGIFKRTSKISYKKLFFVGIFCIELLLIIACVLSYQNRIINSFFDTSAFILAPPLFALGLFIYKTLFNKEKSKNDKNRITK